MTAYCEACGMYLATRRDADYHRNECHAFVDQEREKLPEPMGYCHDCGEPMYLQEVGPCVVCYNTQTAAAVRAAQSDLRAELESVARLLSSAERDQPHESAEPTPED